MKPTGSNDKEQNMNIYRNLKQQKLQYNMLERKKTVIDDIPDYFTKPGNPTPNEQSHPISEPLPSQTPNIAEVSNQSQCVSDELFEPSQSLQTSKKLPKRRNPIKKPQRKKRGRPPNPTPKKDRRFQTTISKTIYAHLKKYLISRECPVDLAGYFRVFPDSGSHRTLLCFESFYWYADQITKHDRDKMLVFKSYLEDVVRVRLEEEARVRYSAERLETYGKYLHRIFRAYREGADSFHRMQILYGQVHRFERAMSSLAQVKQRLRREARSTAALGE